MNNSSVNIGTMYSALCPQELMSKIAPLFEISEVISCEFLYMGANDSYKIVTKDASYLLRIYRKGWRTKSDVEFELDILNHLHHEKVNVSFPIATVNGEKLISIATPEGERFVIMTSFAEGKPLSYEESSDAALYGKGVANIHNKSDNFNSQHKRFKIGLEHLVEESLERIKPYLKDREADWQFLKGYASTLSMDILSNKEDTLDIGFCHGDVHGGNAHRNISEVTFFDFDCCGIGYRAYDLAVFKWNARLSGQEEERWLPFINAYQETRKISESDLALVDDFVSIRQIWLMAFHIEVGIDKGWLDDDYFTHQIKFLKDACKDSDQVACENEN